ncbi:MAG: RsmD family RNA methyltransferase [Proteobacteria bacterium]|nr:RsmD family RNA methyltransferase [Pseudomonadota bacterium]
MRITGGKYKNKVLLTLKQKGADKRFPIRPTMAKTRQAAFNILMHASFVEANIVEGSVVLDLCCGCGSFGLEALSRGARSATFIDTSYSNLEIAKKNAASLAALLDCRFLQADITQLPIADRQYNLVYIDPPYAKTAEVVAVACTRLRDNGWLAPIHVIIVESGKKMVMQNIPGIALRQQRSYGNSNLYFLQCE